MEKERIEIIDLHFQGMEHAIAAFLIRTADGPVLVETGPYSTIESLKKGLELRGFRLADIRHVLLTHIHLDHGGAAWFFAGQGARIYVHPRGLSHLHDPSKLLESARRIYKEEMDRLWGRLEGIERSALQSVGDEERIRIGDLEFTAWHTPGHASHHIAWQLGDHIFTGDVAGVRIDSSLVMPPCPPPDINLEAWLESIQRLRKLKPKSLYLTHFGMALDIDEHLLQLEERLNNWAQWMKPYYERGDTIQTIIPAFEKFVRQQLHDGGITGADYRRYELANPSWMSVAGLLRYWKKKLEIK